MSRPSVRRVLAQHPDLRRVFGGSTVSLFGSSMTAFALPVTAVTLLDASALQMGLLGAAALVPNLVFGLPAGVWLNGVSYRWVIVAADQLRVPLLGVVPVLAVWGVLEIWQLYVIVLLAGTCSLFEAVATESFLPQLVPRGSLLPANSARALSDSVINTSGAALAGVLVALLTAPVVIAVDAVSFVLSALWKARITVSGTRSATTGRPRESMGRQVRAGFGVVFAHPAIRSMTIAATIGALAGQVQGVVLVLYFVRELRLPVVVVGVVLAVAGLAGVVGAVAAPWITARLGHGPTFIAGMVLASLAGLSLAAAGGPMPLVVTALVVGQVLRGGGPSLYGVNQQTIRQTLVPAELLSRALATWRALVYGVQPVGALLGGVLGGVLGFRGALVVSSVLMAAGTLTAVAGPLRRLRALPGPAGEPRGDGQGRQR